MCVHFVKTSLHCVMGDINLLEGICHSLPPQNGTQVAQCTYVYKGVEKSPMYSFSKHPTLWKTSSRAI